MPGLILEPDGTGFDVSAFTPPLLVGRVGVRVRVPGVVLARDGELVDVRPVFGFTVLGPRGLKLEKARNK